MNCEQSQVWMMDELDGVLPEGERRQWLAHLQTCERCHDGWKALQALEQVLERPPMLQPAPGFGGRVQARIAHAEAQRHTLLGGLVLLGAALALCLVALPSLLNGRSPLDVYAGFLSTSYAFLAGALVVGYRLLVALWFVLDTLAASVDIPLASLLTYVAGAVLAVAAWRRALNSQRVASRQRRNGG
jgi:hypothetical protein